MLNAYNGPSILFCQPESKYQDSSMWINTIKMKNEQNLALPYYMYQMTACPIVQWQDEI